MLFTVLNFLPFIEEESPSHRAELCKKNEAGENDEEDRSEKNENPLQECVLIHPVFIEQYFETAIFSQCLVFPCTDFAYSCIKPPPEG